MRAGSDEPKLLGDLMREIVGLSDEQVLTKLPLLDAPQGSEKKGISVSWPAAFSGGRTYVVSRRDKPDARLALQGERPSSGRDAGTGSKGAGGASLPTQPTYGAAKLARSKADRKGGWPWTVELSWAEVCYIAELDKAASDNQTPLNHMVTVRGSSVDRSLAVEKRRLATIVAHIGQALHRAGFAHIGITVYERKRGKELHAHHLLHVPRAVMPVLARFDSPPEVKVTTTTVRRIGYVAKQREQLSPDFERTLPSLFRRQPGDYIPGPRYSLTGALAALLPAGVPPPPRNITPRPRTPRCPSEPPLGFSDTLKREPPAESAQLALPLAAPVIDIFAIAEEKRKALGMSQTTAGGKLGIGQSHWSNSIIRRHDTLSRWALNRIRDLVSGRLAA